MHGGSSGGGGHWRDHLTRGSKVWEEEGCGELSKVRD